MGSKGNKLQEPKENISTFCSEECLKKAGLLSTYLNVPLKNFIGKYVKVGFPIEGDQKEHMWIEVQEITKDGLLKGPLDNDPVSVDYVRCGDIVEISHDEIELVHCPEKEKFLFEEDLM